MSSELPGAGNTTPAMDWDALARYLAGESPAAEQTAVREWLAKHPADAKMLGALDDALGSLTLGPDAERGIDVEAALAAVNARREPGLRVVRGGTPRLDRMQPTRSPLRWVPAAVAAAAVLAVGTLVWRGRSASTSTQPVTTIAARTLTTPVGGRDSLVLPDGSQVTLGPGSELVIAAGYGQADRRISLRGEALFTVVHDETKPFIVTANNTDIRDVGTAFVVHSHAGGVRVAVTDGVVDVMQPAAQQTATRLNVGDVATVSPAGEIKAERGASTADDLAWTRGQLVFRDTPLSEVSEDLRRWYGVHLDIRDAALRARPLSASFRGDSVNVVLEVISRAVGATIERRGDTVVMRSVPR